MCRDQALDIILQTFGLGKSVEGNIVWIAPVSMFAKMSDEKKRQKMWRKKQKNLCRK